MHSYFTRDSNPNPLGYKPRVISTILVGRQSELTVGIEKQGKVSVGNVFGLRVNGRYSAIDWNQALAAAVAEWYRYRIVACLVTSSSPVPLKTRRVRQRCTLNLSRAETSSRWCGAVARREVPAQVSSTHLTMAQNYVVRRQKPSCS
ncbi:uncharacterized protein TNCV_186571 [Trichonephila clavipes]|nr:uncharacterized protein TNCV_186571 [Trichonephila clavipes]